MWRGRPARENALGEWPVPHREILLESSPCRRCCGPARIASTFTATKPNEPPHIHLDRDDLSAKFWLDPVQLASNFGFRAHELRTIQSMVTENRAQFLEAWNEFFGDYSG
jgi:hypothetical protein